MFTEVLLSLTVIFTVAFIIIALKSFVMVKQSEAIIVERFGRYDRTLLPGLHIVVPFIEQLHTTLWTYVVVEDRRYYRVVRKDTRLDLREAVYDFPKQNVITKDNVMMEINALLYYQIIDPQAAVYEVSNLPEAIEKLTQTTLRNVIGAMDLDETLVSRDLINEKLRLILDEATDKWGVKINRVELQEVNPPEDIRIAMEKQMRAERDRRAILLEAEGQKGAAILQAEGLRQSSILQAEGEALSRVITAKSEAEARLHMAEAEAKALQVTESALSNSNSASYFLASQYIKTLPVLTEGKNTKIVVLPYEAVPSMGSLSALKEIILPEDSKK